MSGGTLPGLGSGQVIFEKNLAEDLFANKHLHLLSMHDNPMDDASYESGNLGRSPCLQHHPRSILARGKEPLDRFGPVFANP